MNKLAIFTAAVLSAAIAAALPAQAQTSQESVLVAQSDIGEIIEYYTNLGRAKNLARQAAESTNGGLGEYRAEEAMHGPVGESPYVDNGDGTVTFTIQGRRPESSVYTIETVVTVNMTTWDVVVDSNTGS